MKHKHTLLLERIQKAKDEQELLILRKRNRELKKQELLDELELEILQPKTLEHTTETWENLEAVRRVARAKLQKLTEQGI